MKRIIIAGGSGFLGNALATHFRECGYAIALLTRSPKGTTSPVREIPWDGCTLGKWAREFENAAAVINLTGHSVNCRYNNVNRRLILESRTRPTRVIGAAIANCESPPPIWLNASTATIYKHTYGPAWDESGEIGATSEARDAFSIEVAKAWEHAQSDAQTAKTRSIAMRTAMVLGRHKNSVLPTLRLLTKLGLGGRMGEGRQFVSWIHEHDFCRAVEWLLANESIRGAVNIAAPNPVTNAEMMKLFRKVCGIPAGLPAADWMLDVGARVLGTEPELVLKSRRVIPRRLTESGFAFCFPALRMALEDLCQPKSP